MSRIIVISDIHGLSTWHEIVKKELGFDKIIFIGDYWDSFNIKFLHQMHNFKEIMHFKETNPDKVICLLGNHDMYFKGMLGGWSGRQNFQAWQIQEVMHEAYDKGLLQMCYEHGKYLFTHAGVTKTWCANNDINTAFDIEGQINDLFKYKPNTFSFTPRGMNGDRYGNDLCQTPVWVRPQSLLQDMVEGYIHVVGHTNKENIEIVPGKAAFIDALPSRQYLIIQDGEMSIGRF